MVLAEYKDKYKIMAQFSRIEVVTTMKETGIVPLFYHSNIEICRSILTACYKGGARLFEFTSRGDLAFEIFKDLIIYAKEHLTRDDTWLGSITDAAAASLYMQLGANFIITPVFREDIAIVCNRRKVLWSPGCASLSEIAKAEELGCEIVKLFPGNIYGPAFVKAVKGPCPWTDIMPTGGVSPTAENLKGWFDAGVSCVGMGSKLMVKKENGTYDFPKIEALVKESISIIKDNR
jgi:2-keto-3-deoxy-6-phosphogluconate aldolase